MAIESSVGQAHDRRPDFMVELGVLPPYATEDVKRAYFERAKQAHPDRGGTAADFQRVHEAFQRAMEYVEFRGDRRKWIAAKMDSYIGMRESIAAVEQLGATVVTYYPDWLEKSFGDFAQLTEAPRRLRLVDSPHGDDVINTMLENLPAWRELEVLELPGCELSDRSILRLEYFSQLRRIDLSRTPITGAATAVATKLPNLLELELEGTRVPWWRRFWIGRSLSGRAAES